MERMWRTRTFLVAGVGSAAVAASLVLLKGASGMLGPSGSCRTRAEPQGYSGPPPVLECFATHEQAMTGMIVGGNERQVRGAIQDDLCVSAPLAIADAGKPYCAAMLVNPYTKSVRAQCFDSMAEQIEATKGWRGVSVPSRVFRWDGTPIPAR